MQIGLYEINNLKVLDTIGKVINNFSFGTHDFNPYDTCGICKDHCARIHFHWLSGTFHWPKEDAWKNCHMPPNHAS